MTDKKDNRRKSSSSGKGKKSATLSQQDQQLWQALTKTVQPLVGRPKVDIPDVKPLDTSKPITRVIRDDPFAGTPVTTAKVPERAIDRKTRRRLDRGREKIDRKIDLHGLNQRDALAVLTRTIKRSVKRDMKTVLVVTGKGGKRFSQLGEASAAFRKREEFDQHGGVLKKMVPLWLEADFLRIFVESYGPASLQHGGEGALYVRLRRNSRINQGAKIIKSSKLNQVSGQSGDNK